ncbi:MAG: type II/IV secretion system protein [candidate division Zixibacteria bacterium]|nr:type II/IV secretion system protein [candidate division Zixibacteria bacterium]
MQTLLGSTVISKYTGQQPSEDAINDNPSIIKHIDEIINKAVSVGASDIHFEPFEKHMACRFRVDGSLRLDRDIPKESIAEIIARLKIMSNLDISEKRRPQDGRIRFNTGTKVVDIRVSILPTDFGEKAVLRLLDKESLRLDLDLLGLPQSHKALLEEKIALANGMVLVTGPTGSGKTTTLYAMLNKLRSPNVNITTIEDPIEYNLEGINQTHIRPDIDLTFGNALRAILRQDPNIIMVGEIRDKETLDQAIRASLTGHLVLSTLHTNNAIATITRMLDLGAESYLLGSTLKLIVAQRLVQKICTSCKEEVTNIEQKAAARKIGAEDDIKVFSGRGCTKCGDTGFLGRKAIYEFLPVDETLSDMISKGSREADILSYAVNNGYYTLQKAGLSLVKEGETTPIEILKVIAS